MDNFWIGLVTGLLLLGAGGTFSTLRRRARQLSVVATVEEQRRSVWDLAMSRPLVGEEIGELENMDPWDQRTWLLERGPLRFAQPTSP